MGQSLMQLAGLVYACLPLAARYGIKALLCCLAYWPANTALLLQAASNAADANLAMKLLASKVLCLIESAVQQSAVAAELCSKPGTVHEQLCYAAVAAAHTLLVSQLPSGLCSSRETVPSDDAHARMSPSSCGANAILFTDAVCSVEGVLYTCGVKNASGQRHSK
jgi:hypothetical protein